MTQEEFQGILRTSLAAVGGIVATKGWISAETWTMIAGALIPVGVAIWSYFSKKK